MMQGKPTAPAMSRGQSSSDESAMWESCGVVVPSVQLRWVSGELACDTLYLDSPYDSVEEFIQRMEEGLFEGSGIPRCQTLEDGTWLEQYSLVWDGRTLNEGELLSELDLPSGDNQLTLTLVRTPIRIVHIDMSKW